MIKEESEMATTRDIITVESSRMEVQRWFEQYDSGIFRELQPLFPVSGRYMFMYSKQEIESLANSKTELSLLILLWRTLHPAGLTLRGGNERQTTDHQRGRNIIIGDYFDSCFSGVRSFFRSVTIPTLQSLQHNKLKSE
eukprot:TRINITY_DN24948_c0_g1_i1.p1 TRINITY_DN24948_c0_g1~~TRINITY_DN24948_c0_g1_i1.p1  ORF type:complete len:139 (-),score=5.90 TRINITY_DN24948_c0_g1_i1:16-432(-)